jgi:hypothetical protein
MGINWQYPPPRGGLKGMLDKFIGPGATNAELWLQFTPPVIAAIAAPAYAVVCNCGWTPLQLVISGLIALDVIGGIITNATSSAKRWYHRDGQGISQHLSFTGFHLIHIFIVSWLFRGLDWSFFIVFSCYLMATAIVIVSVPRYLQRPVSLLLYAVVLLINMYGITPTFGLEWFVPLFFLKLLVSHLPMEEPYRPEGE